MSSLAKGDAFEASVYEALAEQLRSEQLCVAPKHAKIFRKKAYHSRDRQADITTDVSIEVFLPGRERPTLVWVFECKDYAGSVPVDDVEEFHSKLQQIGEDNTKGTFVTSGALQKSALTYAESKKIGVVRLLPSAQLIVLLEFFTPASMARASQVDWSEFPAALVNAEHRSRREFFASDDGYWFPNWFSLLSHSIGDKK
jgi:hypothetical protein